MDDSARAAALRLALSSIDAADTLACNRVIAELGDDRGRLIATLLELGGLLLEALEEHDRDGAVSWIEDRLALELDAAASP